MINNTVFTSLCLKLFGVIFILTSLLEYITLAIPSNFSDPQWQLTFVTTLVDRGILPLIATAMILLGYWLDDTLETPDPGVKSKALDLRLPVYVLAIVLGLVFLLLVPVYLSNLNQAKTAALTQIDQRAGQGKEQIQQFLQRISALSANPEILDQQIAQQTQAIESGQLQGNPLNPQQLQAITTERDQLKGLRELAKNPDAYQRKTDEIKAQLEKEIQTQIDKATGEATGQALKQGLRTGLGSLMLAVAYATVGALGLRGILAQRS